MTVEVLYFAEMREITGKEREMLPLKNSSIHDVLETLFTSYPSLKVLLWNEKKKQLKETVNIVIDHKINNNFSLEKPILKNGNKIAFLLPVSGG